jgi:CHAD domain-containing protein
MEAIHKMRTTTKRLRGLFQLIEYLSTTKFKAKKQLRRIRILFKYAGRIREVQIEQMVVWEFEKKLNENYSEYLEYLLRKEHIEIARFLKHLPEIDRRESILNHEEILATIESINPEKLQKKANKFINLKTKALKDLINKPASNKTIHSSRTILKQLYYLYNVLTEISGQKDILNLPEGKIRELEQKIGRWHDLVNTPNYLNAFLKTKSGKKQEK